MTNCPGSDYLPIENFGIVGDLRSVALVGLDASIVDGIEFIGEPTASTGTSSRSSGAWESTAVSATPTNTPDPWSNP